MPLPQPISVKVSDGNPHHRPHNVPEKYFSALHESVHTPDCLVQKS